RHRRDARNLPGSNPRGYAHIRVASSFRCAVLYRIVWSEIAGLASQHALRVGPPRARATPQNHWAGTPGCVEQSEPGKVAVVADRKPRTSQETAKLSASVRLL